MPTNAFLSGQAVPEAQISSSEKPRKPTIMLHYEDDALGIGKRLLFEAATPAAALEIAAGEAAGRHARLFVDGEPLCSLLKADDDFPYWIVAAAAGVASGAPSLRETKDDR